MSDEGIIQRILTNRSALHGFLSSADYPAIISICLVDPSACKEWPDWAKVKVQKKRDEFIQFLSTLNAQDLRDYLARPDVKPLRSIQQAFTVPIWDYDTDKRVQYVKLGDLRKLKEGERMPVVTQWQFREIAIRKLTNGELNPNMVYVLNDIVSDDNIGYVERIGNEYIYKIDSVVIPISKWMYDDDIVLINGFQFWGAYTPTPPLIKTTIPPPDGWPHYPSEDDKSNPALRDYFFPKIVWQNE